MLIKKLYERAFNSFNQAKSLDVSKELVEQAFLIRCVEEKFLELFSEGKLSGTVHTCIGQELTGIALCQNLGDSDWVTSNHRCHGHFISKTGDWKPLIDELLGLSTGVSKGIGSSQHLYRNGFISNGTQGSLLPVASGLALKSKLDNKNSIAVSFIGEGTLGEGVVYEAMNLSALYEVGHIVVCENNYYSQSTPQSNNLSGDIKLRAEAFSFKYFEASTWDFEELLSVSAKAVEYARSNSKPVFLKIDTYRLRAHSKGDDDRAIEEVDSFINIDLIDYWIKSKAYSPVFEKVKTMVDTYVEEALTKKDILPYTSYGHDKLPRECSVRLQDINNSKDLLVTALRNAYKELLIKKEAMFIGEDIADPYGGAFKVTKGFTEARPTQVLSTPISEAGLVGLALGFDVAGRRAIAEIMFGDFIVNALDQLINNASKFYHMYGQQFDCRLILRAAMGGGRGYGPTHSQSLEKLVVGIDNVAVVAVTSLSDPSDLIDSVEKLNCPVVIIENKVDYAARLFQGGSDFELAKIGGGLGTIKLIPHKAKATVLIVAYGRIARLIADNYEYIFSKSDVVFELVCPQLLHPFPLSHISKSLNRLSKIVIVEESTERYGWADGIASLIVQNYSRKTVRTVSSDPFPIPSYIELEKENLVSLDDIITAIKKMDD